MAGSEDASQSTNESVMERVGSMSESVRNLKERVQQVESRLRRIEDDLKDKVARLEARVDAFGSASDENKQKWSMALNFVVQLMWVITASFVLAKLGFQVGFP